MTALVIGLVVGAVVAWAGMAIVVGAVIAGTVRERDLQVPGSRTPDRN